MTATATTTATAEARRAAPFLADNAAMSQLELAEAVRQACIQAALDAYEDAGVSGLCAEGRWEAAIGAMQSLDLKRLPATPAGGAPARD